MASTTAAAEAVYNTTELVVKILSYLPAKKILELSVVDQRTNAIIHRTPEALHEMIFTDVEDSSALNPLLPIHDPSLTTKGCSSCRAKSFFGAYGWASEIVKYGLGHAPQRSYNDWFRRLIHRGRKESRAARPIWHVHADSLRRIEARSPGHWRQLWLGPDKGPVEVHVVYGCGYGMFECFIARTLGELVPWALYEWSYGRFRSELLKWRLEMLGAPEDVVEELGLKDVVAFDGQVPL